jgi:nucleoid-associated protein YgaU
VQKAKIRIISSSTDTEPIEVMFNPTEYQITRNMSYADVNVPGLSIPILQFVRGESQQLQLELFIDSSDRKQPSPVTAAKDAFLPARQKATSEDVAGIVPVPPQKWASLARSPYAEHRLMALRRLAQIDSELHAPPVVEFSWAAARFQGVITGFTEKFTMFDEEGHIVRARVQLQLRSWRNPDQLFAETNPQSPDRTRARVVRAGERLDVIAADEYGDPTQWVAIAKANNITRPRLLAPGTLLVIPPLE